MNFKNILNELAVNNLKCDRINCSEDGDTSFYFFLKYDKEILIKYASLVINKNYKNIVVLLKVDKSVDLVQATEYNNLKHVVKELLGFINQKET
jgi:hypothetical protein